MKENILDLQSNSIRDNFVFTDIPKQTPDDSEKSVKDFDKTTQITSRNSTEYHRMHWIRSQNNNNCPHPIIAKFENYKQKELVQRPGRQLQGTNDGLNKQCLKWHSWALKWNEEKKKKGNHHHCGQTIHKWRVISWLGHYPPDFSELFTPILESITVMFINL